MLRESEKLLCACGCRVPIVEMTENRLMFRKRVNGVWHFLVVVLPEGTTLDSLEKEPA